MAKVPIFCLFDSVFRHDGASPALFDGATVQTGSLDSIHDWRVTPRVTFTNSGAFYIGSGQLSTAVEVDSYVIANHDLGSAGGDGNIQVGYRDGGTGGFTEVSGQASRIAPADYADDKDLVKSWTNVDGAHDEWGILLNRGSAWTPSVGEITLGKRLVAFDAGGTREDLDPKGFEVVASRAGTRFGSPVGTMARFGRRRMLWNWADLPGFPESFFENMLASPDFEDFCDHVELGLPFWKAWNLEDDPFEVFMARTDAVSCPLLGSFKRRGLVGEIVAYERFPES